MKTKQHSINSTHELEYLTNFEADRLLRDYLKSLKNNGIINIKVSDMDFYAHKWLKSTWNEDTLKNKNSDAQQSFKALWGEQTHCDPWTQDYNQNYSAVRKSGYNQKRLIFLLIRIGYKILSSTSNNGILEVTATKPLGSGERQDATKLENIRLDHRKRYEFAASLITKTNAIVTDGACGVAYGSYILAQNKNISIIQALDISKEAIEHGKKYFHSNNIKYFLTDLEINNIPSLVPDYFISFETIEHLPSPEKYIEKISKHLKPGAIFIGSTPNEEIMPYNKYFAYHTKHFAIDELKEILIKYKFENIQFFQQKREEPSDILEIDDGQYIIFVAKKSIKDQN